MFTFGLPTVITQVKNTVQFIYFAVVLVECTPPLEQVLKSKRESGECRETTALRSTFHGKTSLKQKKKGEKKGEYFLFTGKKIEGKKRETLVR